MLNIEAHHFETIAKLVDLVDLDPSISNHIQIDIFKKPLWSILEKLQIFMTIDGSKKN